MEWESARVKAEKEGTVCADQVICSMMQEVKCKQRVCLQEVQKGCRFQCMSVFGVLYS